MAASIKVSELQEILSLTSDDLFLVTDLGSGSSRKVTYATLTSGLEAQIGTSQATLQANIDTLRADLSYDLSVETSARTEAISTEITARQQAVATLQSLINSETSARTVAVAGETTAREQAVAALQALVDALQTESSSRLTRIETLETSLDNLDIDIAPETLNSIDELAAALGDDPQIITNLQSQLTDYIAHIEARNLEAGLATGVLYADTIYGG